MHFSKALREFWEPHLENHCFRGHLTTPWLPGKCGSPPRPASVSFQTLTDGEDC